MDMFDWQFPYHSQRMPVLARNCVATSQPLAAQAGLRMMLKGGNAVDGILATAIALTVLEPTSNGIGADAFCILWDGKQLKGLNASGRSPAARAASSAVGNTHIMPSPMVLTTLPSYPSVSPFSSAMTSRTAVKA